MSFKHLPGGAFVNKSEREAAHYLSARVPNVATEKDWVLLTNYVNSVTAHHLADELDLISVGPSGIIAVEIKHWNAADLKNSAQRAAQFCANA